MSNKIRILHCVIGSMNVGGIENMIMQMYRHIDRNKIQFDFLVHDYNENYYEKEIKNLGGRIHRIINFSKNPLRHIYEFKQLLKLHSEYRIIHIHTTYSIMITDAMEAKRMGRVVIIHSHNSNASLKRKIFHTILKNKFAKYADYKISCSSAAGKWMFPLKYQNNIMFWPNAKNLEKYQFCEKIRTRIRTEEKVENLFVVGNIGRLSYQKNQELMIDIFCELLKKRSNSVLWLIGDGEDRQKLENIVKEKNLKDKVKFWGNISNVNELLFAMDTFVLTSRYEGLAVVLIEVQAAGVPLIVPKHISKEGCIDKNISFVNNINDKNEWISKILSTNTKREENYMLMCQSNFNILKWINEVENFYLSI